MGEQETTYEYGVEIPGRGYVTGCNIYVDLSDDPYTGTPIYEDAMKLAERTANAYRKMRCPEVAETVRLISRTVIVSRSEWAPMIKPWTVITEDVQ